MTARKRLLNHGGHELVTFEQGNPRSELRLSAQQSLAR